MAESGKCALCAIACDVLNAGFLARHKCTTEANLLLEKLAPFKKFLSHGKEEARPKGGIMENGNRKSGENCKICIIFIYYDIIYCDL